MRFKWEPEKILQPNWVSELNLLIGSESWTSPFLWTRSSDSLNRFIYDLGIITSPLLTQLLCRLVFSLFCSLNKSWLQKTGLLTLWAEMSEVSILRHETLQLERGKLCFQMLKGTICCQFNYLEYEPHSNWLPPNVFFFFFLLDICIKSNISQSFWHSQGFLWYTVSPNEAWISVPIVIHLKCLLISTLYTSTPISTENEFSVSVLYQTFTVKIQSFQEESMWLRCNLQRQGRNWQNLTKAVHSEISVSFKHAIEEKLYEQIYFALSYFLA